MDTKPVHTFEIAGAKGGLFKAKPSLGLHDTGISWQEGSAKKFVTFAQITQMKYSKYYGVVTITHSGNETKKINLTNVGMFETIFKDFARKKGLQLVLKAE